MTAAAPLSTPQVWQLNRVWKSENKLILQSAGATSIVNSFDDRKMCEKCIISTDDFDRVGDVVVSPGGDWSGFAKAPACFLNHQGEYYPLPIAFAWDLTLPLDDPARVCTIVAEAHRVLATEYYTRATPEGAIFYELCKEGLRGKSIGFNPISEPVRLSSGGYRYDQWEGLEFSNVGTACNSNSHTEGSKRLAEKVRKGLDRGVIAGERLSGLELLRKRFLEPMAAKKHGNMLFVDKAAPTTETARVMRPVTSFTSARTKRWDRSIPREFDVTLEPSRPMNVVYDWVSRHIGVEVKHLWENGVMVPGARMGSFLTGLKQALSIHQRVDVRNLRGDGTEKPPIHRVVQLNSRQSDDFLIDGLAFYTGPGVKFVVRFEDDFSGELVTVYTSDQRKDFNTQLLDDARRFMRENNFLKNEAFALSGEFLPVTKETWGDVFLEKENEESLQRTLSLFNAKGLSFGNRGTILTGPPGTGKTLSGRCLRNTIKGTYIWLSSRDFHYAGGTGGIGLAYEMARELAPAVVFMEDVDNWLSERTIDYLKTEMDGIARSTGVWTILTTNFPERLPEALIDRPGRFDDVLLFNHPTETVRRAMLARWLPDAPQAQREQVARATDGYSGAHVYELASFARKLQEHDGLPVDEALKQAVQKVEAQRELITQIQLAGSKYKPDNRYVLTERQLPRRLAKSHPVVSNEFTAAVQKRIPRTKNFTSAKHV